MTTIIITVEGGVIQDVTADDSAVEVIVIDHDADGMPEDDTTDLGGLLPARAIVARLNTSPMRDDMQALADAVAAELA